MTPIPSTQSRGAPVLWIALILLALCIAGTLAVVVVSAVKGADELPRVYHSEGAAADQDLAALADGAQRELAANISVQGTRVAVELTDRHGVVTDDTRGMTLRLTHATRDGLDQTLTLESHDGRLEALASAPLAAGAWLVELRPSDSHWLLRGRIGQAGGRVIAGAT